MGSDSKDPDSEIQTVKYYENEKRINDPGTGWFLRGILSEQHIMGVNKQQLLRETLRVLKKGGTFAIHDIMSKARYGDMDKFIEELRSEGYEGDKRSRLERRRAEDRYPRLAG